MYRMNWKKNAVHTAEITGYTAEGMGVARLEGRVVFVPGTIRGERWTVRLEKVTKNVAWARGVELLEASPERLEPDCPLAGRCGGCQFRHMTYAEELLEIKADSLVVKRRLEHGTEIVECPLPLVMTVNGSAPECRPQNAKRVMKYKFAQTKSEIAAAPDCMASAMASAKAYLQIVELAAADVDPDETQLGLVGSPTKVKKIENVVFQAKESKRLTAADADIESLMVELIASHTLG